MYDSFPVEIGIIKHPVVPRITVILSTQRRNKQIKYDECLICEALRIIDAANAQFGGYIDEVNVDALVSGLKFDNSYIKCYFTLIFKNDHSKERFLKELIMN